MTFGVRRPAVVQHGKQQAKVIPVYGGIRYTECYHTSDKCSVLSGTHGSTRMDRVVKYENAAVAYREGHIRLCERCAATITITVGDFTIQLSPEQADTMATVYRLKRVRGAGGKGITKQDVADGRGVKRLTAHKAITALIKNGMLVNLWNIRGPRDYTRGVELTELGAAVLAKIPSY